MEVISNSPVAFIIFLFTIATSIYTFYNPQLFGRLMFHPYSIYRKHHLYQFITSGFIHKDWSHLIFNMISFYFFAFQLETIIGSFAFAILYLMALIISDLPSVYKHKNNFHYHSLGASGAVCAVLFSYILFSPLSKLIIFPIPFPIPAYLFGILYLAYSSYAARQANDGINHEAHLYGAIFGIVFTIAVIPEVIQLFIRSF